MSLSERVKRRKKILYLVTSYRNMQKGNPWIVSVVKISQKLIVSSLEYLPHYNFQKRIGSFRENWQDTFETSWSQTMIWTSITSVFIWDTGRFTLPHHFSLSGVKSSQLTGKSPIRIYFLQSKAKTWWEIFCQTLIG